MSLHTEPPAVSEPPSAPPSAQRRRGRPTTARQVTTWGPVAVLVLLAVATGFASSDFWSSRNLANIADQSAVGAVIALGMTFVVVQGSIDLSVEGVMALCGVVVSLLVANNVNGNDLGWIAIPVVMVIGAVFGALNGLLFTRLRLPSLMITLGTWSVGLGLATIMFPNTQPRVTDQGFRGLALHGFLGLSWSVWVALAALAVGALLERFTRFGRYTFAIGGDEAIARLSGVKVDRYKVLAFVFAGAMFALAAVLATARSGYGDAQTGNGELFTAVTAIVIGGTLLSGGRGGVVHSTVGVLILGVLTNGMVLVGVNTFIQGVVSGALTIIAVAASTWPLRSRMRVVK